MNAKSKAKSSKKQKKAINRKKKSAEKSRMIIEYMQDFGTISGITKKSLRQNSSNRKEEERESFKFLSRLTYLSIVQLSIVFSFKFWTFNNLTDEYKLLTAVLIIPFIILFYSLVVSRIYFEDDSTKKTMLVKGRRVFDHLLLYSEYSPPFRFLLTILVFNTAASLAHFEKIQFSIFTFSDNVPMDSSISESWSLISSIRLLFSYSIAISWYVFWFGASTYILVWFPKRVVDWGTNLISVNRTASMFTLEIIYYCTIAFSLIFSLIEAIYALSNLI